MNDINHSLNTLLVNSESSDRSTLTSTTDPLWTVGEVAGYLKLQPETVRGMARRGDLPGIKIGKVWRFRKSAIKKIFQEQP
ncbi:MAG TPA: helix-turn-helix domain-containing protein [Anaerolineales bacterium]|nr:helix-turn-helix domain-containing protein [Anaerolineales bacterium]